MWYTSGSGRIQLQINKALAEKCTHSGDCEPDVLEARQFPVIRRQLDKIDPKILADELKEYGAWDDSELANHDQNLTRILWLACGDITDGR